MDGWWMLIVRAAAFSTRPANIHHHRVFLCGRVTEGTQGGYPLGAAITALSLKTSYKQWLPQLLVNFVARLALLLTAHMFYSLMSTRINCFLFWLEDQWSSGFDFQVVACDSCFVGFLFFKLSLFSFPLYLLTSELLVFFFLTISYNFNNNFVFFLCCC